MCKTRFKRRSLFFMTQLSSVKMSLHHNSRALTQAWHKFPLDLQAAATLQFFRTGLKWAAGAASDSLGGKGLMVERIRARQSATFLFVAQARAGVWPAEDWKWFPLVWGQETWTSLVFSHRNTNVCAYLPHLQPWLLLLCSAGPALLWPNLFWLQCEEACMIKKKVWSKDSKDIQNLHQHSFTVSHKTHHVIA